MSSRVGEKTEFGPGKTALYYNNKGLFSDPFLEDRLPNIEKYASNPSSRYLNDFWNIDESKDAKKFDEAFQGIMNLWNDLKQDVPKYCSKERQVQNTWIDPIFRMLGWTIELEETSSKNGVTNYPDYALFADKDDWRKFKELPEASKFKKATAVADAKDWGISLDGKGFSNKNPSFQIINYLKQTDKSWGILTDGKYWRIYSLRSDSKHTTFYEIDLEKILASGDSQRFKYFYNFFRVDAFVVDANLSDRSFLDFVFEDGKFYAQLVDKNLNARVYKVVNSICQGFLLNYQNPTEQELKEIYANSMYYLFKLMFILNCESKGLLEVNKQDDYYEFSLRKRCLELKEQLESGKNWSSQPRTYNLINDLFELLKTGDQKIGVYGFGNEPFEIGSLGFYRKNKVGDVYLNTALLDLSCDKDDEGNLQFIDYKILSPDHIGSLFEGLLEFNLVKVENKIELLNTKGERKSTGSYYTPEHLVDFIVKRTLEPIVDNKNTSEILKMKFLDPSMGSGHFLLGTLKYLEGKINDIQLKSETKDAIDFDQITRNLLKNCIFGIDINPLSVELAKFSLWIYSSHKGSPVEQLGKHLIQGNSLEDMMPAPVEFSKNISIGNVDGIIGNPPYIGEKGNKNIFQYVKQTSLGKRFYIRKMDYFYFFIHLGLDLLKENGRMGYITTNYFLSATSGNKLRTDLKKRSDIDLLFNTDEYKIFKSAQGQHNLISILEKRSSNSSNKKVELWNAIGKGTMTPEVLDRCTSKDKKYLNLSFKNSSSLFEGKENYIRMSAQQSKSSSNIETIVEKSLKGALLGEAFNVNQGILSGADKVSDKHLKKIKKPKFKKGDGVYVLSHEEYKNAKFSKSEEKIIKPWFKNSDIQKYSCKTSSTLKLIYATRDININDYPNIKNHLFNLKEVIEQRSPDRGEMQAALKLGKWWVIFAARKELDFDGEKIVAPQRSFLNTFAYNEVPWYSSADVYYITPKEKSPMSMKALTMLLNSKIYYVWLFFKGKRKGHMLELYQTPLSEIQIPEALIKCDKQLKDLFDKNKDTMFNSQVDKLIYKELGLSDKEIESIEQFCADMIKENNLKEAA